MLKALAPSLAPLRQRSFLLLWSAFLVSSIGTQLQLVGAVAAMAEMDDSPRLIAFITSASSLPVLAFALIAGALSDLHDRRRLLLIAQGVMMLTALAISLLIAGGWLTPWLLLGATFVIGCAFALNGPSWQASVRELVPASIFPAAVALNSAAFNVGRMAGPALGALVVARAGPALAYQLNAIAYFGILAVLWRSKRARREAPLPREQLLRAIAGGLRFALNSPAILSVLLRCALFGFGSAGILALAAIVAAQRMGGVASYGLLLASMGAGSVAGGLLTAPLRDRFGAGRAVSGSQLVYGAAALGFAAAAWPPLLHLCVFLAGGSTVVTVSTYNASLQLVAPRWVAGRLISLYHSSLFGGLAAGAFVLGLVADHVRLEAAVALGAAVVILLPVLT